ncbi:MAG: rhomboid family intramembrane serine protease [Parachlamydia sp.]|jgi:membrane associated rhomboid family serine protease|nr:rhomboid family intramembrane serine protease [Parachlamydia sp.]
MMPLGDDNSLRKSTPIVTYILIALNILFFLAEWAGGEEFIKQWAFIPRRFSADPLSDLPTLLTSMFMHAGIMHLASNMLYLWIFGDNIEDHLGKGKYLLLYLLSGLAATFAQYMVSPGSNLPNVGASGAIAGVLGAYILYFPGQKIKVLLGPSIVAMPSLVVIGFWFFLQLVSGAGTLFSTQETGGVAYMAHVGGFVAGLATAFLFRTMDGNKK